jgi:pyruvate kinase
MFGAMYPLKFFSILLWGLTGTDQKIAVDYVSLPRQVAVGSVINLDDGLIHCTVTAKSDTEGNCTRRECKTSGDTQSETVVVNSPLTVFYVIACAPFAFGRW